jgi:hypothetical protein
MSTSNGATYKLKTGTCDWHLSCERQTDDSPTYCSLETCPTYSTSTKDWLPTRMQGKCTTQPDAANFPSMNGVPLVRTTTGQCLLLSYDHLMGVVSKSFWADNLYLRTALPGGDDRQYQSPWLATVTGAPYGHQTPDETSTAYTYLTNMIFQGDGKGSTGGISAGVNVFVSGSHQTCLMF